jgi:chromosome segregation protein
VLQRFLVHSQFIIITHSKRTIGMADVLYGVTMQEHGVSKIVSVKFHKADEAAGEQKLQPLEATEAGNGNGNGADAGAEAGKPEAREEANEVVMAK